MSEVEFNVCCDDDDAAAAATLRVHVRTDAVVYIAPPTYIVYTHMYT